MTSSTTRSSTAATASREPLLRVEGLRKHFPLTKGVFRTAAAPVRAVDGISFDLDAGETLGLVGESGCGKSTAGRTVLQLLKPTAGKITYQGRDITGAKGNELQQLRREMQMVFQDPYGSLNPRHTIGSIVGAPFRIQKVKPPEGLKPAVQNLMERVGLNPEHYNRYPHEFSGGQRQRIGIARALALRPKILVCDEPVSALDVSIQAQVINLLEDIQRDEGLSYLFVAHDLSVVRHIADRVAVMYLGKIMELAPRDDLYSAPLHPYTHSLLSAVPVPDPAKEARRERILLTGDLPSPINPPSGCVFHTRCPKFRALPESDRNRCTSEDPQLELKSDGHYAACHFPEIRLDTAVLGEDVVADVVAQARAEGTPVEIGTAGLESSPHPTSETAEEIVADDPGRGLEESVDDSTAGHEPAEFEATTDAGTLRESDRPGSHRAD